MKVNLARLPIVLLLGFVLVWQTIAAAGNSSVQREVRKCCVAHCPRCTTERACCEQGSQPSSPVAAVPAPAMVGFQALLAVTKIFADVPSISTFLPSEKGNSSASSSAVPLFQRNCIFLI